MAARPAPRGRDVFEPAQVIARVGDQPILAGDVLGDINQMIAPALEKVPPEERDDPTVKEMLQKQKLKLMKQLLEKKIEYKLLYLEFLRNAPAERLEEIRAKLAEDFYENDLETILEKAEVDDVVQLDAKLRKYGSSLEKVKASRSEQKLGQSILWQHVDSDPEITHAEMLDWYRDHLDEYSFPARVRWEQLTVEFENFSSKAEAWAAIAEMGNQVLRGARFAAVAREHSQDYYAQDGGQRDWIEKGSLRSKRLEEAIFSLPPNQLSRIIEDDEGFYIVRVLEREEAGRTPFTEAQVEIEEKLRAEKRQAGVKKYLAKLRERTPIWTVFDDQPAEESQVR